MSALGGHIKAAMIEAYRSPWHRCTRWSLCVWGVEPSLPGPSP